MKSLSLAIITILAGFCISTGPAHALPFTSPEFPRSDASRRRAADHTPPLLTILTPTPNQRATSSSLTIAGRAQDAGQVVAVYCQLNGQEWTVANTTNTWSSWWQTISLRPGPNVLKAYAVDMAGNSSLTNTVTFSYALTARLVVRTNGTGVVNPRYNGQYLEVGKRYTLTASPVNGFRFVNWTNNLGWVSNSPALNFVMQSDLVLTATFVDAARPVLTIKSPTPSQRILTNSGQWLIRGTTADNGQVAQVLVNCNGEGWEPAPGGANWQLLMDLVPGPNTVSAFAVDAAGNRSPTNRVSFTYVVTSKLVVQTNGCGAVNPKYNGQQLELGKAYVLSAAPANGFRFVNWSSNLGWVSNSPALKFVMRSNLVLTASFVDVTRPVLTVTSPIKGATAMDDVITASGKVSDNDHVAAVFWKLNNAEWQPAAGTSQWAANLRLASGPNTLQVYALDVTGNTSLTNVVSFTCAKDLLLSYWPMHEGDWKSYSGLVPDASITFHDLGAGAFTMDATMDGQTITSDYQYGPGNHELTLSGGGDGWLSFSFVPPIVELDDTMLLKGGSRKSQTTMYFSGTNVPATVNMTVSQAGTLTVPTGTYRDCRRADATITLTIPGHGNMTLSAEAYILAPRVGAIQVGIFQASGSGFHFVGWDKVTDGVVDGVNLRELIHAASASPEAEGAAETMSLETAESTSPTDQPDQPELAEATLEYVQQPNGQACLKLSGKTGAEYLIEAEVSEAGRTRWDPFWVGTLRAPEALIPIDASSPHTAYRLQPR